MAKAGELSLKRLSELSTQGARAPACALQQVLINEGELHIPHFNRHLPLLDSLTAPSKVNGSKVANSA